MVAVVLVDRTRTIDPKLLQAAADALDYQVSHQLAQTWSGISASVSDAASIESLPPHAWPVFLVKELPPGEGGFHMDKHNQPYAKVIASAEDDSWTIDASHEIIEMLVDPFGNRMQTSQAIEIKGNDVVDAGGVFQYLVEACDPCEANQYAYDISGIAVSDFITPNFYDALVTPNTRYSFMGNIKRPRQMLPGGYISYVQPNGSWNQILWVDPNSPPQYHSLSSLGDVRSLRLAVHEKMGAALDGAKHAQRRKPGPDVGGRQARVDAYRALRDSKKHKKFLEEWYELA